MMPWNLLLGRGILSGMSARQRLHFLTTSLLSVALVSGCDSADPGAETALQITVLSPYSDDAAALVEIVGTRVDVTEQEQGRVLVHASHDTTWVFVAMDEAGRIRLSAMMPRGSPVPSARLLQVADGGNNLRAALDGYSVRIRP
ncbi:MAG: hypothetical protein JSW51_05945 [Gemmatimonadota bacterium]|nr:MAG: hypothetical protein JSW51_05945 [Gemmatimonadota bacterium]